MHIKKISVRGATIIDSSILSNSLRQGDMSMVRLVINEVSRLDSGKDRSSAYFANEPNLLVRQNMVTVSLLALRLFGISFYSTTGL